MNLKEYWEKFWELFHSHLLLSFIFLSSTIVGIIEISSMVGNLVITTVLVFIEIFCILGLIYIIVYYIFLRRK